VPFTKGKSGNPNGRPKGRVNSFRSALKEEFAKVNPLTGKTRYQEWAEEMLRDAIGVSGRLEVLKFLEGATPLIKPSDEDLEESQAHDGDGNAIEP
jgi:hypothetical protein